MIKLQYYIFRKQNICSTFILVPVLVAVAVLVNHYESWAYNSHVILTNSQFNISVTSIILLGMLSLLLSIEPRWYDMVKSCSNQIAKLDDRNEIDGPKKIKCVRYLVGIACLFFSLSPIIVGAFVFDWNNTNSAYLYFGTEKETIIIQVWQITFHLNSC